MDERKIDGIKMMRPVFFPVPPAPCFLDQRDGCSDGERRHSSTVPGRGKVQK